MLALVADVMRDADACPSRDRDAARRRSSPAIRQDQDNPARVAVEALMALLYPGGHPYGRPSEGHDRHVERIDRAALVAAAPRPLRPGRRWCVVASATSSRRAPWPKRRRACSATGAARPPSPADRSRRPRRRPRGGRLVIPDDEQGAGGHRLRLHDHRARAIRRTTRSRLMNNVLGQYALGGRLGDNIRERQGMAYYVFSSLRRRTSVEGRW